MTKSSPLSSPKSLPCEVTSEADTILEALARRDESALQEVSRLHGRMLRSIALRITGDECDAEECVNDALLDLWNAVPPDNPSSIAAYVSSLVRRRAIDRVRYRVAKQRAGDAYLSSTEELSECLSDPDASDPCETMVIRDCLQAFVDQLTAEERRIFLLRYYRFEPQESIAELCGLSVPAVAMRLMRLRKRLKKALEAEGIHI